MVAVPATGTTFRASGVGDVDSRFNTRGGLAGVLIRNNRGAATNISPWVAGSPPTKGWSPFALDGKVRSDLFATVRVAGEWITNPLPNEGFWQVGALTEDGGPERAPNINQDNQMILQSNFPFDTDLTEEGIVINFTGVETLKPMMKRLRMNVPLSDGSGNSIVEDPGFEDFSIGKPVDVEASEWQIILMFARKKAGKFIYTAEGYSLCKLTNIGNFRRSKTDPDAGELGYTVLPDPFLLTKDPANPLGNELIPVLYVEWTAGDGWAAIGGAPVFPGVAPTVTPGATGVATLVFDAATGAGDPFVYTVEKTLTPFSTFTTATITTTTLNQPTVGKVTIVLGSVPPGSTKFRVSAEGTNGQITQSQLTTAATIV
jgi:hypothetical protein